MATALPIDPVANPLHRHWIIDEQLPANELVFLDGLTGVGKSSTVAHYAAYLSNNIVKDHPTAVLYLTSYSQHRMRNLHLSIHQANHANIRQVEIDDFLASLPETPEPFFLRFFQFIREQITEHRPALLVIDSIEEMFKGQKISEDHAHDLFILLQKLARSYSCTVLIPRKCGMHERHYSTLGRGGTAVAEFILTLHWHPTQPSQRVLTLAKNLRGPMGTQWHQRHFPDNRFITLKMEPHQHVKPSRSPATWQADAARKNKTSEIVEEVKDQIYVQKVTAVADIHAHLKKKGYGEHASRDAIARMEFERMKKPDGHYHLVPKLEVDVMYYETQHTHEARRAETIRRRKEELSREEQTTAADIQVIPLKPETPDTHTQRQAG